MFHPEVTDMMAYIQVEFDGAPLMPSRWPNTGNAIIKTIYDSGAFYTSVPHSIHPVWHARNLGPTWGLCLPD